jgi:hypothetical protein
MSSTASLSLLVGDPSEWGIPPVGKVFIGINLDGKLVIVDNDGVISVVTSVP